MSLLYAVEDHLGPIDTWPSYIIEYLFLQTPTPEAVKKLAAFFSGNCVSMSSAYRLYHACNPAARTTQHVRAFFKVRHFLWQNSSYVLYRSTYYNVFLKNWSISRIPTTPFHPIHSVEPDIWVPAPALGIAKTSCPNKIRRMLNHIRRVELL
jgi:hypothetical protein